MSAKLRSTQARADRFPDRVAPVPSAPSPTQSTGPADDPGWTVLGPSTGLLRGLSPREVLAYRNVATALARRSVKASHKQSALGVAWLVLRPAAAVVAYTLIFGELAGLPTGGLPYPVFVLSGLVAWNYFAAVLGAGAASIVEDRQLIGKIYFPRILSPIATALPRLIDLGVELALLAVLMVAYGVAPTAAILAVPAVLVVLVVLAVGLSLGLAALNVEVRDIGLALPFAISMAFYATPVVYAQDSVGGWLRTALSLNPMTGLVDLFRWATVGASFPPAVDLLSAATGLVGILVSLVVFQQLERRFADVV